MALTQVQTGMIADSAVTDAKIAAMAASKLSGRLPAANSVAGSIIKSTNYTNNTRTSLGMAGSTTTVLSFWSLSFTKLNSASVLFMNGYLHGRGGSNGEAVYWWRINGGTWYVCGAHNYISTYSCGEPLTGYLNTSSLAAGTYTVEIGYSSGTGRPFNVWNPNSSDHAELTLASQSTLNIYEVLP